MLDRSSNADEARVGLSLPEKGRPELKVGSSSFPLHSPCEAPSKLRPPELWSSTMAATSLGLAILLGLGRASAPILEQRTGILGVRSTFWTLYADGGPGG